jgi:CDP-diacylglycerol--glycerol-3-phosphate 3-phosphatidyltransferase
MLWFAFQTQTRWVAGMFLFLAATDWLDGKLAVLLDQRSKIGPRLDTIADVTVYACLLGALLRLPHFSLRNESLYLTAAIGSYAVSVLYSLHKFRCIPSYHTRAAKTCWLFVLVGVLSLFLQWSIWPLRIALVAVALANVEAILITRLAKEPLSDIEHFGLVNKPRHR